MASLEFLPMVVVAAVQVFGFSADNMPERSSSALDLDLPGLREALVSSAAGSIRYNAAHWRRIRRDVELHEYPLCCGDYNPIFMKKESEVASECWYLMENRKFEGDESKKAMEEYFCFHECMYKKQGMCDSNGNVKHADFKDYCGNYYNETELNVMAVKICDGIGASVNIRAKYLKNQMRIELCSPAAAVAELMHVKSMLLDCPSVHLKTSPECVNFKDEVDEIARLCKNNFTSES
ncbi:uncharacterized protein [Periplaneta americana]|uniref:uncharacterized protein n=1 Tax=Periplaneta americana TaxID=6978 RepID=UPI0037E72A9B